jgi:hypothetical protein
MNSTENPIKISYYKKNKNKNNKNKNGINKNGVNKIGINNNNYFNNSQQLIMDYFSKQNKIVEKRPEYQSTTLTISGLDYINTNLLVNTISIFLGIIIFALIPYVANNIQKPITSAILNVVPNGMILGYFIVAKSFIPYFTGLIIAPLINPLLDLFTYYLYFHLKLSAPLSLTIGIGLWALMVLIAYELGL